ncbi:MAG: hypothetical protein AABX85_02720 [Nanoarchaeota archaeon]
MVERWYNSDFGIGASVAVVAFGLFLGLGGYEYLSSLGRVQDANAVRLSSPIARDLNGNKMIERYIEIDSVKYFSEIDGKNLEKSLTEKTNKVYK